MPLNVCSHDPYLSVIKGQSVVLKRILYLSKFNLRLDLHCNAKARR